MTAPQAPCAWDAIPCGCELDLTVEATQYAVETASFVLWALSGRQFGCCELSFRPCRRECWQGLEGGQWGARLVEGDWVNLPCRRCTGRCACSEVCEVRLPHAPACSVVEVVMDGETLASDLWRLEDSEWLVVDSSAGCFPECQDMSLSLGDPGTWGVVYEYGTPPPTAARRAVGALACEIIKACSGDSSCCLPKRTQSYNRQGISVVLLDSMDFFDKGRTGIYEVDLFLSAVNPLNRPSGARVVSPDSEPRARADFGVSGVGGESS